MNRFLALALTAVIAISLGGCTVPESRLDEYKERAEELRVELDAQMPSTLLDEEPTVEGDVREGAQHGPGGEPSSPAWWQVRHYRTLVNTPNSSEQAAQALHDYLTNDGWRYRRARTGSSGASFAEGYRRNDDDGEQWYVEITWAETTPDRVETVSLLIVSPTTTLGTDPPEPMWSGFGN